VAVHLTAAHWVYLAGVIVILTTMVLRKNIVVPAVVATFLTALVYSGSLVKGLSSVFNASLVAAVNLFNIFLIIALVTAMLGSLQAMGADRKMVAPFRRVMRNGHLAFWTLAVVTYFISLFFWPTPAVPLIGAVLIPVAIRAGLPAMGVGLVIAIAGQGMALSSDYVIRVAPGLSAKAAGVDSNVVADRALVLSLIVGGVALVIAYVVELPKMRQPSVELLDRWKRTAETGDVLEENEEVAEEHGTFHGQEALAEAPTAVAEGRPALPAQQRGGAATATLDEPTYAGGAGDGSGPSRLGTGGSDRMEPTIGHGISLRGTPRAGSADDDDAVRVANPRLATIFAIIVPVAYLALIIYMVVAKISDSVPDLKGGDAAALVGGIAALLLFLAAAAKDGMNSLETSASHVVDGLVFAFKAMGVVLPIAGFFFIGNGDFAGQILGLADPTKGPAFLYDLVNSAQSHIPQNGLVSGFGLLAIGMVAGLEGSGFSGLPLTGSLAGSLGPASGTDPATLAAIGQMGNIWSGGGTLVAWSSLIAVAGFARVPVVELARKCFIPVVSGLVVATLFAVIVFG
jgi:hypothetical protein